MSIAQNFPNIKPSLMLSFADTKQLDSRITYTRASTASFYNGVTTAKAEENLVAYSQEFDNAAWIKAASSVTANTTTAPDGTSTADSLIESTQTQTHYISGPIGAGVIGQVYTLSIYAKANTRTGILLYTAMNGNGGTYFDLSAGTVGTTNGTAPTSSAISSVGSGWYRCSITYTATITSGTNAFQCFLVQSGTTVSYTGDGTSSVYLWGAQIEQRSAISAYTATTTQAITNYIPALQSAASGVARFDNNPTTSESLGLLIEESRTNLLTYSEDISNAVWTKAQSSIDSNTIVAPDGTLTGDKWYATTSGTTANTRLLQSATVSNATAYTASIYVKSAGKRWVMLSGPDASANSYMAWFDLTNGVVGTKGANATSSSITTVGNGWYRLTVTSTSTSITNYLFLTTTDADNSQTVTADSWSGVYVWGAQVE
jgi:hypothetical protein